MSVLETNQIDLIATRPESDLVKLVITDHLDWSDLDTHCRLLQDKFNTYLEFIESGQLTQVETPKIPLHPDVRIVLAMKHEPTVGANQFLAQARAFLAGVGLNLEIEHSNKNLIN